METIQESIDSNEAQKKLPILQKAHICKDIEFMIKSMPWFRRIIVRRATHGTGKISVGGINQTFKLESEAGYVELLDKVERLIKSELQAELITLFEQAGHDSWTPKLPFVSPKKPATPITPQLFHSHLEDFTLFF